MYFELVLQTYISNLVNGLTQCWGAEILNWHVKIVCSKRSLGGHSIGAVVKALCSQASL